MTLDCGFSNATVKGHFCELLVSNIIDYLSFYWIVDQLQIHLSFRSNIHRFFASQGEIYLIVRGERRFVMIDVWFRWKGNIES